MKNLSLSLLLAVIATLCTAQNQSACQGQRYLDEVFSEVTVEEGVQFGEATTFGGNDQELKMDIYHPANDQAAQRAAVVVAFGGSFIEGERGDVAVVCETLAKRGYVAAAIDYRLFDGVLTDVFKDGVVQDVVVKAIHDMKAAVRFLRADASGDNRYGVDPEFIYASGISAGAIVANHVGMIDSDDVLTAAIAAILNNNGGLEGASNDLDFSSAVRGVVNMSGGLIDLALMDADDAPIYSVHEVGDPVVPFGSGSATVLGIPIAPIEGSGVMHMRAEEVGLPSTLVELPGNGHVGYLLDIALRDQVLNGAARQVWEWTCPDLVTSMEVELGEEHWSVYPNPTTGRLVLSEEVAELRVRDMWGRVMLSLCKVSEVDISELAPGIYMLEWLGQGGRPGVERVVLLR